MPQEIQTIEAALEAAGRATPARSAEVRALAIGIFRGMRYDEAGIFEPGQIAAVINAITEGIIGGEGRDYHRRDFLSSGSIYDPATKQAFSLVAVAPATPDPDLIDGFEFTGMDWGDDEPTAAH